MLLRGIHITLLSIALAGFTAKAVPMPQEDRRPTPGCTPPRPTVSFVTRTVTRTRTRTQFVTATATRPATTFVTPPVLTTASVAPPPGVTSASVAPPLTTTTGSTPLPGNNAGDGDGNPGEGDVGGDLPDDETGEDPQTSNTLSPEVIVKIQDNPKDGQAASAVSVNNFIDFCSSITVLDKNGDKIKLNITNGEQIDKGSCNPAPMGVIPSSSKMPSSKFIDPPNFGTLTTNASFTVKMSISNLVTGNYVNSKTNFLAAPQTLVLNDTNADPEDVGKIIGHSHFVIQRLQSRDQIEPLNPTEFIFFKAFNEKAVGGVLEAQVTAGLPAGEYMISSINTAANHQPVLAPVAQHGSLNDVIYVTVTDDGNPSPGNGDTPVSTDIATATATDTEATSLPTDVSSTVTATDTLTTASGSDALPTDSVTDSNALPTESVTDSALPTGALPTESVTDTATDSLSAVPTQSVIDTVPSSGSDATLTATATGTPIPTEPSLPSITPPPLNSAAPTPTAGVGTSSTPCKTPIRGGPIRGGRTGDPAATESEDVPLPEETSAGGVEGSGNGEAGGSGGEVEPAPEVTEEGQVEPTPEVTEEGQVESTPEPTEAGEAEPTAEGTEAGEGTAETVDPAAQPTEAV